MADSEDHLTIPGLDGDWPAQAADTIEQVVSTVRDRAVAPILTAARAVVYAFVGGTLIFAALLLLIIGLIRALDNYLPGGVWVAYFVLGGVLVIGGLIVWTQKGPGTLPEPVAAPALSPASTT
jgi:hypothetical protein